RALPERTSHYQGSLVVYYPAHLSSSEQDLYLGAALITGGADRRTGIAMLERAVGKDAPAKALAVLGEGYLGEGDAPRAIDMFRRAAEKDPALGKARYNLGQALEAAGRLQEARAEYEQAHFPESHYALANLLVKLGEPALSLAQYQEALRERPVYAEAHSN